MFLFQNMQDGEFMVQGFEEGVWRCGIQDKWFDRGMKWNIGVGDKTRF